ncbi:hypothetical protein ACP70R_016470 [Stipagrostis hirtigluma subsp. patula]
MNHFPCLSPARADAMDGQGDGQRKKKAHGNPYPKRGGIKKAIIKDWSGKKDPARPGGNGNDNGNGGGGDAGDGTTAAGCGAY